MKNPRVGIMSIATNLYVKYWEEMIVSLDLNATSDDQITSHIFTDQPLEAKRIAERLTNIEVKIYEIPSFGWPDATIRRFEIFHEEHESLCQDILVYIDADMLILQPIVQEIIDSLGDYPVALVAHPGFWRQTRKYRSHPLKFVKDRIRPKGTWENRRESMAFVSRINRRNYVCGGIWFGYRKEILKLIEELALNVVTDRNNGITAIWHDESHLNAWSSKNSYKHLSPSFCHVSEYEHLNQLEAKIQAVTKIDKTR